MDNQFSFRDSALAEFYDQDFALRGSRAASRSQAARRDLQRYQEILKTSIVKFSESDAVRIFSALLGSSTAHSDTLLILRFGVIEELEEPLKTALKGLSPAQWIAIVDACDRVGAGSLYVEDLTAELRRVGLC